MLTISPRQRLVWGLALIAISGVLLMASFAWMLVLPMRDHGGRSSNATVSQYRSNVTASTTPSSPSLADPTQTNITISFPAEMTADETRRVSVKVERFTVGLDLPSGGSSEQMRFEKKLEPVKAVGRDVEIKLVSSGFDVQGLSTAKEGAPFPLGFTWTISPKKEGKHELLLDLSDFVRDARSDSSLIGTTEVRVHDDKIDLKDGAVLPLHITVTGQFGVPGWLLSAGASLPGFFGFILTYPLFLDWLKRRRTPKPNKRLKGTPRKRGAP
jgi:hypothetical protein